MGRWAEIDTDIDRRYDHFGLWAFSSDNVNPWAWNDALFTPDECDAIIGLGNRRRLRPGSTRQGITDYRESDVAFIHPDALTGWVFQRLTASVSQLNEQFFGFDLTGFGEGLQFTRYAAPGQHYKAHIDMGFGHTIRKLSLVVQLSDPADYEGGELELDNGEPFPMERSRGRLVAFPSWTVHRVTPVTEGTRYSLVAWITGPAFR